MPRTRTSTQTRTGRFAALTAAFSLTLVSLPAADASTGSASTTGDEQTPRQNDFGIVVLPDTQYDSKSFPTIWDSTGKWIADQAKPRNIRYALHVGDVVHNSDEPQQWTRAVNGMDYLDGAVPYIIGPGNHDMDDAENSRAATAFNEHFPRSAFSDLPSFGGTHPSDGNDNSYHTFSAGGTDWLALALKYEPTQQELDWANRVVANHPDHQTMIVTHSYQKGEERTETGDEVWNELASKHENISFVFSGHHVDAGMIEEQGDAGNTVYQIQADYQNSDNPDPNSFLRYLRFSPSAQTVDVRTYSPHLDENKTGADNHFTIDNVDFLSADR